MKKDLAEVKAYAEAMAKSNHVRDMLSHAQIACI